MNEHLFDELDLSSWPEYSWSARTVNVRTLNSDYRQGRTAKAGDYIDKRDNLTRNGWWEVLDDDLVFEPE